MRSVTIGWYYAVRIKFLMLTLLGFGIWGFPNYYPYKMDDKMTFSLQRQTPYYKACPVGFLLSPLQLPHRSWLGVNGMQLEIRTSEGEVCVDTLNL